MKAILSTLLECKNPLLKYLSEFDGELVNVRELTACYTTNAIASIAFGIDTDCFVEPDNPFRTYGRKAIEPSLKNMIAGILFTVCPKLMKMLRIRGFTHDFEEFFIYIVKQTLELREKNHIVRKDFFQLLIELRNTGTVRLDDEWQTTTSNNDGSSKSMTIEKMTSEALLFYLAGFENTSAVISFCLYEIDRNCDVQMKVHAEIDNVFGSHSGQFTYDSLSELKYLECCIDETLRKYPVAPLLFRECTKEYKINGMDVTLEKGTTITIPIFSLQRDEKYYANPQQFDPSPFFSENTNVMLDREQHGGSGSELLFVKSSPQLQPKDASFDLDSLVISVCDSKTINKMPSIHRSV